ncbi:MAG TPA: hypothetical protein PLQ82_05125 [Desulfobacteraceae bacterium]|nr:hypothetical protein [Desulfobacteraceae bacterium]HPQ27838.1 hypothetical protein [Desulfobacteraceae bacterium]
MELNHFKFRGIPIGSLITSHLILDLMQAAFNPNDYLKETAMFYYLKFFPKKQIKGFDFNKHAKSKGLPILTFISERRHIFDMSYPVYELIGSENIFCLIKNEKVFNLFGFRPTHYSFRNELPTYAFKLWRKDFQVLWSQIEKTLTNFIDRNDLPITYRLRFKNNLLGETRYLISFEIMLEFLEPKYILTHYDRYSFTASLCSVAKKFSIPVFTMSHGIVGNSIGYTPLIADKVFAWGERQMQDYLRFGLEENKIVVAGAPQMSQDIKADKAQLKAKLGIKSNIKIILLATNPIQKKLRIKLFEIFCIALNKLSANEYYGVLKIHPSENMDFYTSLENIPPNLFLDREKSISYEEYFALADMVCNYNSAFAIDAILRGLPLVTINVHDGYLFQAKDYFESGKLPVVTNGEELASIIEAYFNDNNFADSLNRRISEYASKCCYASGKDAARNILLGINEYFKRREIQNN